MFAVKNKSETITYIPQVLLTFLFRPKTEPARLKGHAGMGRAHTYQDKTPELESHMAHGDPERHGKGSSKSLSNQEGASQAVVEAALPVVSQSTVDARSGNRVQKASSKLLEDAPACTGTTYAVHAVLHGGSNCLALTTVFSCQGSAAT